MAWTAIPFFAAYSISSSREVNSHSRTGARTARSRLEGPDPDLEPDLVVSLPGGAVGDRVGAALPRRLHQEGGDQRTGEGGGEEVLPLVAGAGAEQRPAVLLDEAAAASTT